MLIEFMFNLCREGDNKQGFFNRATTLPGLQTSADKACDVFQETRAARLFFRATGFQHFDEVLK